MGTGVLFRSVGSDIAVQPTTNEKVAQLQKSELEVFAHLYLFFQSKIIYLGKQTKKYPAPEVGGENSYRLKKTKVVSCNSKFLRVKTLLKSDFATLQ